MASLLRLVAVAWVLLSPATGSAQGIFAVWYAGHEDIFNDLPYLVGGQISLQWADLETGPGIYDWRKLDSAITANAGRTSTLQINGNRKPQYLFDSVPHVANWGEVQVDDTAGVLMYWHPAFVRAYTDFLDAQARHLYSMQPSQRSAILGIRTNYNPVGTEKLDVPAEYQSASVWTVPPGVANGPDFTAAIKIQYQKTVLDAYLAGFVTGRTSPVRLFVRNNLQDTVQNSPAPGQLAGFTYLDYFRDGTLSWMETGSEMEPRAPTAGDNYQLFVDYCRSGMTTGYAEPWADSWGNHGGQTDPRWCTPVQWNYWRLLSDLHKGISYVACYGGGLTVAQKGTHGPRNVGAAYQAQYDTSFRFAARYAGFADDPAHAPGGWIAFRVSASTFSSTSPWSTVTDYSMHLSLLNPQDMPGLDARDDGRDVPVVADQTLAGEKSIGPYNQRFGAWARRLPAGAIARIRVDTALVRNLNAGGVLARLIFLDSVVTPTSLTVRCGQDSQTVTVGSSGAWKAVEMPVRAIPLVATGQPHVTIRAEGGDVVVHLVEVTRDMRSRVLPAPHRSTPPLVARARDVVVYNMRGERIRSGGLSALPGGVYVRTARIGAVSGGQALSRQVLSIGK